MASHRHKGRFRFWEALVCVGCMFLMLVIVVESGAWASLA